MRSMAAAVNRTLAVWHIATVYRSELKLEQHQRKTDGFVSTSEVVGHPQFRSEIIFIFFLARSDNVLAPTSSISRSASLREFSCFANRALARLSHIYLFEMAFLYHMRFLCCALFLVLLSQCDANLMGVDLGLGYIKVAVARPGKGLELVTNEQSKRKTPAAVGFTDEGERLFGDAAVAYSAKAPKRAILDGRSLIGQCLHDETLSNPNGSPLCPRDRLDLEGVGKFTGEEVIAMLLAMAKRQASAYLGGASIKDVAITVPAWYDERQRQAVADAARVIGLNCLGVVNANTAAAIKYALDGKAKPSEAAIAAEKGKDKKKRTPKTVTQRVMFYDLGAGSASASIAEVTSDVKTGIASSIKMRAHAWEMGVSGRLLDSVVVDRLADAFDKQRGPSATPSRDLPRVMMRLRKEAQRAKEVLSANTDTMVSVASLYDDLDLRTTLSRADFESDASSMLQLVGGPVKEALTLAGLKTSDLDAVVPFGGASRTPKVQRELCNALGISVLNKSINTDEAAVMGSAFFAASLSSTFRVRKMDVEDVYTRSISAEIEKEAKSGGGLFSGKVKKPVQKVEIFSEGLAKMPSKKTLSLNRKNDFSISIFLEMDKTGKARFPERTLYSKLQIKGVSDVLKKLKDASKAKVLTPRVAITFHVDRSGLIRVGTAESSVDETVVVEREVEVIEEAKNKTEDNADKKEGSGKKKTGAEENQQSKESSAEQSNKAEDGSKNSEGAKDDDGKKEKEKPKKKTKIEKSSQTIVHRNALTIEYEDGEGILGMQMSGKELQAAQKVLKDLEIADRERVELADALNSLEGFILEIRSNVRGADEDDILYQVSTEEERDNLVAAFDEGEDWMYTEEAKQTANLRKKHHELRKLYEPLETRAAEFSKRPVLFKNLVAAADVGIKQFEDIRLVHVERNSDKVEVLEEFIEYCKSLKTWVAEMESAQAEKSPTEEPVVTLRDIAMKGLELKGKAEKLAKLEPPPPPKEEKKEGSKEESNNSTATEAPTADDEVLSEGGDVPSEPDAEAAKADAASSSAKDEL